MTGLLFGLNVSPSAAGGADPVEDARVAESLGFDFVSMNDHLHGPDPRYETWTALSWIAASTSRIRVATRVLGVPYRHPAVVAKMAETFDRFSGGRLILGLGAGASDDEFGALGLEVRSAREKIEGLEEAVTIIRGMWSERTFTLQGRVFRTERAEVEPKPEHPVPIWLGTFGDRALSVTGRLADGWIPSLYMAPPERVPAMKDRVFSAAREAGREPEEITLAYNIEIRVDERGDPNPLVVAGPPGAVAEELLRFVELGFTAFNFLPAGPDGHEQAERLAREVIPEVRRARS
jgi:alkanesulfonate monooxygenase SsuD/methylene tetrahydromethanopterin reductase-like flavin-dependent oxidoreductase (luciferase family)